MITGSNVIVKENGIQSGGVDSILPGVWRKILSDLKVDDTTILDRIERYSKKVTKDAPDRTAQIRGNLRTDVSKDAMTWFTFTKCLRVLGVHYFEITFTFKHLRTTSSHTMRVQLHDDFFLNEKDEEVDDGKPSDLSLFFNQLLHNLKVDVLLFEQLLEQYLRRTKVTNSLRNRTHIRGYLKKDFSAPKMSWKSLVKGLVFLCVLEAELKISLAMPRSQVSHHSYNFVLGDHEDYLEELSNGQGI